MPISGIFMMCAGSRPEAPVAEGGPVGFFTTGGTDGTGSPGPGAEGGFLRISNHTKGHAYHVGKRIDSHFRLKIYSPEG